MSSSSSVEGSIRRWVARLEQDCDRIHSCSVLIERPHNHRAQGNHFHVRIDLAVPGRQIVVSHDSVWCWNGMPIPSAIQEQMAKIWNPTHFLTRIAPQLRDAGVPDAQIDALLLDNPRRFFAGEAL